MRTYDNYDEIRYEDFNEGPEILSSDTKRATPTIDSASIAEASAEALNGPNGREVCKTIRFIVGIAGILGLAWLFEGSNK